MNRFAASMVAATALAWLGPTVACAADRPDQPPKLAIDLAGAVVVTPVEFHGARAQAVTLLIDEVEKRTGIRWPVNPKGAETGRPAIIIGFAGELQTLARRDAAFPSLAAEGYQITTTVTSAEIVIAARDARGLLFGIGRLLRTLGFGPRSVGLAAPLDVISMPRYPIRGVQLGYRAMSNSYSGWNAAQFEQQIRDLAVFGCNIIELVSASDREAAREFPLPPSAMRIEQSRLADRYGLDVWMVAPVRERDYRRPESVAAMLQEWESVFAPLPRLDAVFVPGGDPGSTPPEQLLPLLEKLAGVLRRLQPKATLWVSPQGFNAARIETFFSFLAQRHPPWLTGVVSAAWTDLSTAEIRRRTPSRYAVISSTDIGHVLHCQQPVQDFDTAFAVTEGREPICPRPADMTHIVRTAQPGTLGTLAYSDGCTDDVNKIVVTALGWDPDSAPDEILREYGRYFVSERLAADVARGMLMLERNWHGPLPTNPQVPATLAHFKEVERRATLGDQRNWRLLSLLYRAYFDAYTQQRLIHETRLEAEAMKLLETAGARGAGPAMTAAEAILEKSVSEPVAITERTRVFQLAEALFQAIHLKLSVPLYGATSVTRGANLDSIDWPLNNRQWLRTQFAAIRRLPGEADRQARLERIAHWTDAGPGGRYDDFGQAGPQPRVPAPAEDDPRFHCSAHAIKTWVRSADFARHRLSWLDHVATLGATPLELTYRDLEPGARYKLRVVYGDTKLNNRVRLVANGRWEIHPLMRGPMPPHPMEFTIPPEATRSGVLVLQWQRDPGVASIKGVCHVSELWLLRLP